MQTSAREGLKHADKCKGRTGTCPTRDMGPTWLGQYARGATIHNLQSIICTSYKALPIYFREGSADEMFAATANETAGSACVQWKPAGYGQRRYGGLQDAWRIMPNALKHALHPCCLTTLI
eukprot:1161480-Pelagomonas_calceolata.AAC.15